MLDLYQRGTVQNEAAFSVSAVTELIKTTLEEGFRDIRIEGEISNFRPSSAGHWYFCLKDEDAIIGAVMFRGRTSRVDFRPADGLTVRVRGSVSVYAKRGNYQIICESMERSGEGAILAMLEERKRRLAAEGLFDPGRKRQIPPYPGRIAVITSPTGAALRDILQVTGRRGAGMDVTILPTLVQGDDAAEQIARQIGRANRFSLGEVIILGRGGGSLEDLLPFSEEIVVRAIADSTIPVISAVGHETDTSLADYAADLRAPTPSAAAELVCSEREALLLRVQAVAEEMGANLRRSAEKARLLLERFTPGVLHERMELLFAPRRQELDELREDLGRGIREIVQGCSHRLELYKKELEGASPLTILEKGYAVVQRKGDNSLLTRSRDCMANEEILVTLHRGSLDARITRITGPEEDKR